jgi:hypothetical protein
LREINIIRLQVAADALKKIICENLRNLWIVQRLAFPVLNSPGGTEKKVIRRLLRFSQIGQAREPGPVAHSVIV